MEFDIIHGSQEKSCIKQMFKDGYYRLVRAMQSTENFHLPLFWLIWHSGFWFCSKFKIYFYMYKPLNFWQIGDQRYQNILVSNGLKGEKKTTVYRSTQHLHVCTWPHTLSPMPLTTAFEIVYHRIKSDISIQYLFIILFKK